MVVTFKQKHLDGLELTSEHREVMDVLAQDTLATTIVSADKSMVIAVLGACKPDSERECEVFLLSTPWTGAHVVTFWRSLRQEIDRMKGQFDKIRAVGADTALSRRFLSRLGFVLEGPDRRPGCEGKLMWAMNGGKS